MAHVSISSVLLVAAAISFTPAASAQPEALDLFPGVRPGDVYELSLSQATETDASARGERRTRFEEALVLGYEARVEVLEVDAQGRATRERHSDVELTVERDGETGSLFRRGTRYEVHRDQGRIEIHSNGRRVEAAIEKLVAPVLAAQLEHGDTPALLDPGRPVRPGESWELSPERARRLLREAGVRVVEFDGAARATLVPHESDPERVSLRYRIPVGWCEVDGLAPNLRSARSGAVLEGILDLEARAPHRALRHDAELALSLRGFVEKRRGVAAAAPWRLERETRVAQRNRLPLAARPIAAEAPAPGPARIAD